LPKGTVEAAKPSGPWGRYKARYIDGENASVTPLIHLIFGVFAIGYTIDYHFHLSKFLMTKTRILYINQLFYRAPQER
jgi:hypothetical protein